MNFSTLQQTASRTRNPKGKVIHFGPFSGGLVTARPAEMLGRTEMLEASNVVIVEGNQLRTRPGLRIVCDGLYLEGGVLKTIGTVTDCGEFRVADQWYTLMSAQGADGNHALYYIRDDHRAEKIGPLEGESRLCGFNELVIITDGGTIKAWDGTRIGPVYDDGLGPSGYIFNRRNELNNASVDLGDDLNGVGVGFVTAPWTGGTIPPTTAFAVLSQGSLFLKAVIWEDTYSWSAGTKWEGEDTYNLPVWFRIRKPDGSLVAEVEAVTDGRYLNSVTAEEVYAHFSDGTIYEELYPETLYILWVEFGTGLTGRVSVYATDVQDTSEAELVNTAIGDLGTAVGTRYWGMRWEDSGLQYNDKDIRWLMALKPGAPPNAVFAISHSGRVFAMEGADGDNPSYLHYCAAGDPYDWSSPDGGGYADNYREIGAIASYFGSVWIFGSSRDPGLYRLTGASPVAYALENTMQEIAAHYRAVVTTPDDVYFLHQGGVDSLKSVQEFGDVRAASQTDAIGDIIRDYYDEASFMGYDPGMGLVLFSMPAHEWVYVVHTRIQGVREYGEIRKPYAPVTRWPMQTVSVNYTAMGRSNSRCLVGTANGLMYEIDHALTQDHGRAVFWEDGTEWQSLIDTEWEGESTDIIADVRTAYYPTRMGEQCLRKIRYDLFGDQGGEWTVEVFKNHNRNPLNPTLQFTGNLPVSADDPPIHLDRRNININFRHLMVRVQLNPDQHHLFLGPFDLMVWPVGGL